MGHLQLAASLKHNATKCNCKWLLLLDQVQLQAAPAAGPVSDQSHAHGHVHVQADERMLTLTSTH